MLTIEQHEDWYDFLKSDITLKKWDKTRNSPNILRDMLMVHKESIFSEFLNRTVDLSIVEPSSYDKTLVMLHGYNGSIEEVMRFPLLTYAETYKMLIVIAELGNMFYLDRIDVPGEKDSIISRFLTIQLPDFISTKYSSAAGENIIIGGYSMGGFGAILHALKNPRCFRGAISLSGAFITQEIADGSMYPDYLFRMMKNALDVFMIKSDELPAEVLLDDPERNPSALIKTLDEKQIEALPPIVLTCATKDYWYESTLKLKKQMELKGIKPIFMEIPEGGHSISEFEQGLDFALREIGTEEKREK